MKSFIIKCLIFSFCTVFVCLTSVFGTTNKKSVEVDYNTKGITINYGIVNFPQNQKPFALENILYVPLTFFAETLGYKAENYLNDYINIDGGDVGRLSTQVDLLKDAMDYIGVATPEKAVEVWSEGLMHRSAAIQYSVMTKELKEIYEKDLEKGNANWVTGVSSPWVESYKITKIEKANAEKHIYEIKYDTATSAGAFEPFTVILEVNKAGDFWRISKVSGDNESTAYTGFTNQN